MCFWIAIGMEGDEEESNRWVLRPIRLIVLSQSVHRTLLAAPPVLNGTALHDWYQHNIGFSLEIKPLPLLMAPTTFIASLSLSPQPSDVPPDRKYLNSPFISITNYALPQHFSLCTFTSRFHCEWTLISSLQLLGGVVGRKKHDRGGSKL